jgi:hypothetical protein
MKGRELLAALQALTPEQLELEVVAEGVADGMPVADSFNTVRVAENPESSMLAGWRMDEFDVFPRLELDRRAEGEI